MTDGYIVDSVIINLLYSMLSNYNNIDSEQGISMCSFGNKKTFHEYSQYSCNATTIFYEFRGNICSYDPQSGS